MPHKIIPMAAKKLEKKMMEAYTKHILVEGKPPVSVYSFTEMNKWKEKDFYKHYASFKDLESRVFIEFFDQTMSVLNKDKSFEDFDAFNKLLSFYYTYFELLTANRSLVFSLLKNDKNTFSSLAKLNGLKHNYQEMVGGLKIDSMKFPNDTLDKLKSKGMEEAAWGQFLLTLKFWMDDSSANFEKTDLYIEKSLRAGFEVLEISPLQSVVDLGKFLFKEKFQKQA